MLHPLPVVHMFAHQEPSFHHNLLCGLSAVGGLTTPEYVMLGVPTVAAWALPATPRTLPATARDRTSSRLSQRRVCFIFILVSLGRRKSSGRCKATVRDQGRPSPTRGQHPGNCDVARLVRDRKHA